MKNIFALVIISAIASINFAFAQKKQKELVLSFNKNCKFKIVQFTDVHFKYNSFRSDSALVLMKSVIVKEEPDLVVLTGDIVCSKNTREAWISLSKIFTETKTPWAVTLGNHDIEYELTGKEIMNVLSGLPYCLTINGPKDISGNGNYVLKILSSKSKETEALLYFLDSHSGLDSKKNMGSYDWIKFDQVDWYREQSSKFTKQNGGNPYPALAFLHIPLPEYNEVLKLESTKGIYKEKVCCPAINSGMYLAMFESKDVMGMFTGHDHDNNYIGCLRGICMAYGQSSGRQCYGKIGRGARVIELYEGKREFDTWILNLYECDRDKDIWKRKEYKRELFVSYPKMFEQK